MEGRQLKESHKKILNNETEKSSKGLKGGKRIKITGTTGREWGEMRKGSAEGILRGGGRMTPDDREGEGDATISHRLIDLAGGRRLAEC